MKKICFCFFIFIGVLSIQAQSEGSFKNFNTKRGYVAEGYDLVSYFDNKAQKGDKKNTVYLGGLKFMFSSQENALKFKANPEKYMPQYGGYCAYAIAEKGKKVSVDPETFEIREDKLYLFYNSWGVNTLELWLENNPDQLKDKADQFWETISRND